MSDLRLDHLNIPAQDPIGLAKWYAETFSLQVDKHVVRGPGLIIVFKQGDADRPRRRRRPHGFARAVDRMR